MSAITESYLRLHPYTIRSHFQKQLKHFQTAFSALKRTINNAEVPLRLGRSTDHLLTYLHGSWWILVLSQKWKA